MLFKSRKCVKILKFS